jgi:negative regulator of flagellin synthesis FlgM
VVAGIGRYINQHREVKIMAIEISGQHPAQLSNAKAETKGQVGRTDPAVTKQQTGQPSTPDTVTLTDSAAQLHKLEATILAAPIVDTARVEDVKQAIHNGQFQIDPQRVADKMLRFENALGHRSLN